MSYKEFKEFFAVCTLLAAFTAISLPSLAEARGFEHRHEVHGWERGHWYHGAHDGRIGWWWLVGRSWFFFARPLYPYPDPYVPPTVVVEPQIVTPPPVQAQPAPPPLPSQNPTWYYCKSAQAYYPYVSSCPDGWTAVPAVPPQ